MATCRYCGATVTIQGAPAAAGGLLGRTPLSEDPTAPVFLEHPGDNKIEVIKVIREHTGLGLKDSKDLCERAPCVVANWPGDLLKQTFFREALIRAGARVR